MSGIVIEGLTFKRKERTIFDGLSVSIPKGQFVGLLGPNGTGKSTFLRAIAGLLPVDRGDVFLQGTRLSRLSKKDVAKLICYMPQTTQLETNFTVQQVVEMGRYPHKSRFSNLTRDDYVKVEEAIQLTGIERLRNRFVPSLSGGERQLVFLAKVIAQDTPIILLDEPTSDLDVYHQELVTNVVHRLVAQGKTVMAAIHDINYSARICDQCLFLKDGKVMAFGDMEQVLTKEKIEQTFHVDSHIYVEQVTGSKQMIPIGVQPRG